MSPLAYNEEDFFESNIGKNCSRMISSRNVKEGFRARLFTTNCSVASGLDVQWNMLFFSRYTPFENSLFFDFKKRVLLG